MDRRSMLAGIASGAGARSPGTTRAAQAPGGPAAKDIPSDSLDISVMDGMFRMPSMTLLPAPSR